MKKRSLPIITGILILLVVVFAIVEYTGKESRKGNFKQDLVAVDTSLVDKIIIKKNMLQAEEVVLTRIAGKWMLTIADGRKVSTALGDVDEALAGIAQLKATRLVSKKEEHWAKYQVDSTGIRVQMFNVEEKLADIIIGKFEYKSQQEMYTYFRVNEFPEVYPTPGFIGMNFNAEINNWRNQEVLKINRDTVKTIRFEMADSSFVLTKEENQQWFIGEQQADSAAVQSYLHSITYVRDKYFVNQLSEIPGKPLMSLTIYGLSGRTLEVYVFMDKGSGLVINSTSNPDGSFFSNQGGLINKLFKSKESFLGN